MPMPQKEVKSGTWVLVDGHEEEGPAQVATLYDDIVGGVRLVEVRGGFKSWNVANLSPAGLQLTRGGVPPLTLRELLERRMTLDQVEDLLAQGAIPRGTYLNYYHEWLHGAPRFGDYQPCRCSRCCPKSNVKRKTHA